VENKSSKFYGLIEIKFTLISRFFFVQFKTVHGQDHDKLVLFQEIE